MYQQYIINENMIKKLEDELKKYNLRIFITDEAKNYTFNKITDLDIWYEK